MTDHLPLRYPRGEGIGEKINEKPEVWEIGKAKLIREGSKVCILSLGTRLERLL